MYDPRASTSPDWYWSQRGVTIGPVTFTELRRLMAERSINAESWIYHPLQSAWVQVKTVPELLDAAPRPTVAPPPDSASPGTVFCRFCGASAPSTSFHCGACGRPLTTGANLALDAKSAAIICRASVAATIAFPLAVAAAPAIVWAICPNDPDIVREAKAALNCHITMIIAFVAAIAIGVVGALVIIGPVVGALIVVAIPVYALVIGITGVVAASKNEPFAYRGSLNIIR